MNSASVKVALTYPASFFGGSQPLTQAQEGAMQSQADSACRAQGRKAGATISESTKCILWDWQCIQYEVSRLYPCKG